jgi:hypothetical protein
LSVNASGDDPSSEALLRAARSGARRERPRCGWRLSRSSSENESATPNTLPFDAPLSDDARSDELLVRMPLESAPPPTRGAEYVA